MQKNILIITGITFLLEFYVYQAFRTVVSNPWLRTAYWIITILTYAYFIFEVMSFRREDRDHHRVQIVASLFLIFILPKLFVVFFLFIEDISRFFRYLFTFFAQPETYYPERRKFMSLTGLAIAGVF